VKRRQLQLLGVVLLSALVMAFLLQDVVAQLIVRPVAYVLWGLGIVYRFIPQPVLWLALVLVLIYLTLGSFVSRLEWHGPGKPEARPARGPLDELAMQIERKDGGIYFKWQIARTLGDIALDLQEQRLHARRRKLHFDESAVPAQVRRYLDAGLNTSFSDYPIPKSLPLIGNLKPLPPTAIDGEIGAVLDYLEAQMENEDDRRRA